MRQFWIAAGTLCAVCLLAYWPVLGAGFLNLDDDVYVTDNPVVCAGLSLDGVRAAFREPVGSIYQPLTMLSLMADASLFGLDPFGFHLMNLLFHGLNTCLLLWWLLRLTGKFWPSLLAAALFALHPLRVESVAWVTERKDVLSGAFFLLTLIAWQAWLARPHPWRYGLVLLAFTLGLLSKQILVTLPVLLLLVDYWPRGRLGAGQAAWPLVREKLPLFALALAFAGMALTMVALTGSAADSSELPLGARLGGAAVAYARTLGKVVWPSGLAVFYPLERWAWPEVVCAGLLLAAITALALWQARRRPELLWGWLWFALALAPMSGLAQAGSQAMADRFTYLPLIGLFVALAFTLSDWLEPAPRRLQKAGIAGVSVILFALGIATSRQARVWHDSETLYLHALATGHQHHLLYNNLGQARLAEGRLDEAAADFERALRLKPLDARPLMNLGLVAQKRGQADRAFALFAQAVASDPAYADARDNLAIALYLRGEYAASWREVQASLRLGGRPHPDFLRALARKSPPPEAP